MLKEKPSSAIVAVSDINRARAFYRDTLGLDLADDTMSDVLGFRTGNTWLVVYRSDEAGTNRANAVVWSVGEDMDAIVADLQAKGVQFEHYPEMQAKLEGDVYVDGGMKMAWFRDPDGNILHLNSM